MPELPEVETVVRTLDPILTGQCIEDVVLGEYQRTIATPSPEEFRARASNRRIAGVSRRGKYILIPLSTGDTITVHLRMTGELQVVEPDTPRDHHVHLHLQLASGAQLRYRDVRKFGRWSLLTPSQHSMFDRSIGPEPLAAELDSVRFGKMLRARRRILKPLLLDQAFIAGIGNIYADEALFRAGIHPRRKASELSEDEAARLLSEIRAVLQESLEYRGTTLRDYRDGSGQPGGNLSRLRIYTREAGEPCLTCGTPVVREVIGQRGSKFCPACQA